MQEVQDQTLLIMIMRKVNHKKIGDWFTLENIRKSGTLLFLVLMINENVNPVIPVLNGNLRVRFAILEFSIEILDTSHFENRGN